MDKQKQIEEMAKVVRKYYSGFSEYKVAEEIYRILIPENAVVLTNDEFWALSNKFSKKELDEIVEFHKNKTRKETAEKFAEMAKERRIEMGTDGHSYCMVFVDDIDEIAKKFMEVNNV